MTPDRWQRIQDILQDAFDLPVAERPTFLDKVCTDDPELRAEVEALLHADDTPAVILNVPPEAVVEGWDAPRSLEGETVGSYRIVKTIGRGGWGMCIWPSGWMACLRSMWP